MLKSVILILLVVCSLFTVPAVYSSHNPCKPGYIEIVDSETGFTKCVFDKTNIEEMPVKLELEFSDYQEHIQILVNQKEKTTEIRTVLWSSNSQDIMLPPALENAILNSEKVHALIFTTKWMCAPGVATEACIMIQVNREGLGQFTETVQENTRKISDQIMLNSQFIGMDAEFHSIIIESAKL